MLDAVQMSFLAESERQDPMGWFANALDVLHVKEESGWPDAFGNALRQWNQKNSKAEVTAISLFSGGGGLDIGFHDAGFKIVECNEIEPLFATTLERNSASSMRLEGSKIVCQDIGQYCPSVRQVDFIIGGPPCQTFSAAGARAAGVNGTDDERGNLFLQYARIIDLLQPKGFLFENVYRIVGAQAGRPWQQIQDTFQNLGYKLYWRILDAADYGVPQFRERLIIVGLRAGVFQFPFPSHGPDSPDEHPYYSAGKAVDDIDTSHCKRGINGRHGYLLNNIPPGLNYSFYTERMGHPKPIFAWRSKFSDYLYKADPQTPIRTLKAQGGQYTGPFSWDNRPFTVEELKRLQTFPDDYIIEGSRQNVIQQLGNSVPPQMARILALSILDQVFAIPVPFKIPAMSEDYQLGFRKRKGELTAVYAEKAKLALEDELSPTIVWPVNGKNISFFSLTSDLEIHPKLAKEEADFETNSTLMPDTWTIELKEANDTACPDQYEIQIVPPLLSNGIRKQQVATKLVSQSPAASSLLGLWKTYEYYVQQYLSKDDLVQLFGYYQYKQSYSISMTIFENSLLNLPFWRVVQKVTSGCGVGVITPVAEFTRLYHLSSDEELMACMVMMKEQGYEIRNHKTNRQIPNGMMLIPYAFPTLNERSLQRLTRL